MRPGPNIGDFDECALCRRWHRVIELCLGLYQDATDDCWGCKVKHWERMYDRHLEEVPHGLS